MTHPSQLIKPKLVCQSNALVQASYRLSLLEIQLVRFAIHQARETNTGLTPTAPCKISVSEFAKAFALQDTGNLYRNLRDASARLIKRSVTIPHYNAEAKLSYTETNWLQDRNYCDGQGSLEVTFTRLVIPHFTRLDEEFTKYDLKVIGQLTSVHAVRLYELLKQYQKIGKRELKLAEIRDYLQLGDHYRQDNIKARVIDPAIEQINKFTDLRVNPKYQPIRTGRNITALLFKFRAAIPEQQPINRKPRQSHIRFAAGTQEAHTPTSASHQLAQPIAPGSPPPPEIRAQLQSFLNKTTGK
jgi:plasmid replication initiation protein